MHSTLSTRKRIFFWGILALLFLGCLELCAVVLVNKFIPSRARNRAAFKNAEDYVASYKKALAKRQQQAPVSGAANTSHTQRDPQMFHAVLGWDYPPNAEYSDSSGVRYHHGPRGERRTCTSFDRDLIATYGDSFTYCSDEEDCHSWQTYLAQEIGANVLNFGVAGYGTDQAYLKYELNSARVHTPIVILGILPDNINRVVNTFRTFYAPEAALALTKPRYLRRGHAYELLPNPLESSQDVAKLEDPNFVHKIGLNDYWFQHDTNLPRLGFPYLGSVFLWRTTLAEYLAYDLSLPRRGFVPHFFPGNLFEEPEPLGVLCHIVDLFIQTARERNSQPLIVLMTHKELLQETIKHRAGRIDNLVEYLRHKGYPFVDLIRAIAEIRPTADKLDHWFREHATPDGNRLVAEIIARHLEQEGFLKPDFNRPVGKE